LGILVSLFLFTSRHASLLFDRTVKQPYRIAGTGLGVLAGCNFYSSMVSASKVTAAFQLLKISNTIGSACIAIIGAVLAIPAISLLLSGLAETGIACVQDIWREDASCDSSHCLTAKKSFAILFGIYLVGISAILRADFNYIDDMGRAAEGYKRWEDYNRYLSGLFATFIHMDNYLTDVSPLPQLLAVALMTLSGIVLLVIVYGRKHFTLLEIVALTPLCLNPYFLECISYKYDAPYMALSIFAAIIPLIWRKRNAITYVAVSAIGTIVVCTTYQASSGIYPMLVILLMLRMWNNQEENGRIAKFCMHSVIGYGAGILIFKMFLMTAIDTSVSNKLPGISSFIPNYVQNLGHYYTLVQSDFKWWWLVIILLLAAGFVWITGSTSKYDHRLGMLISVLALFGMGILCFGLYPALTAPLFETRAMYGFGVLLTLLMVTIAEQRKIMIVQVPVLLYSWIVFVFAFTYGNALYVQKEYTDFRITQVIEDLNDLEVFAGGESVTVQIDGTIGYAPAIENMPQDYQLLNRLIPVTFRGDWSWGEYGFYNYYKTENVVWDKNIDLTTYDLPVIEEHMYHTIRGKDNYILIELK
jgi:hypothetical protein